MAELKSGIRVYITDQSHPSQRERMPKDAIPGFVTSVYRRKTLLESHWSRTRGEAEYIAQEYARQYETMHECGWT